RRRHRERMQRCSPTVSVYCCTKGVLMFLLVFGAGIAGPDLLAQATLSIDFSDRSNDLPGNAHEDFDTFILGSVGGNTAFQLGTNRLSYGTISVSISDLA